MFLAVTRDYLTIQPSIKWWNNIGLFVN